MIAKQDTAKAMPRLRFPEFRHALTWVEESLGDLSELLKGKGLPKSEIAADGEAQCIHYGELFTVYSEVINEVVSRTQKKSGAVLSIPDDVLMPTSDVTPNGLAKASCLKPGSVVLGGDILVIRTNQKIVLGEFLARQIRHREREVLKLVSGTTVFHLYPSSVKNLKVAYPATGEQKEISDCLASLDEVITAQGRKVEALKAHKRGLMQQLFPREGETRPQLRFPEFRGAPEWDEVRVGDLGEVITGNTPATSQREFYGADHLFVSPADISDSRFVAATKNGLSEIGFAQARPVKARSVLFVCIGSTIGKVAQNARECATNQQINAVEANSGFSSDFIYYLLDFESERIAGLAGRQAVPIINKTQFSSVKVFAPGPDEQQRIADCLSSLDTQIAAESNQLAALKTHKQGLMQQLFPAPEADAA